MKQSLTFFLLFAVACLSAQHPKSSIFLFKIEQLNDSVYRFREPKFLTDFNKNGYNNQPFFFNNDELYITIQTPFDTSQTDIFSLNLKTQTRTRVTMTNEREYSPTLMPDRQYFSSVRVEMDKTQRLWQFPVDRLGKGKPVLNLIKNVGYHCWLSSEKVALFIVDDPKNYLLIANAKDESSVRLTTDIGRCFQILPNGNLAYVFKATDTTWYIQELDLNTYQSKIIVKTLTGSEDFAILPEGTFLMGKGSVLYKYHPAFDKNWLPVGDFRLFGIQKIARLAVSGDKKLAIVATE
jgi:Tol biopolymer transport system component